MRDGYVLEADLFLPKGSEEPAPCVLIRTPRGRQHDRDRFAKLTEWGYAVVLEDCRSCTAEGQEALPYFADGWGPLADGYDTVEWLAGQDFCDGKVATVGESALGITQLMLAPSAPPHLVCQYIHAGAPNLIEHAIFPGGQFRKTQVEGWLSNHSDPELFVHYLMAHVGDEALWRHFDACQKAKDVTVPAVHYGGWFDTFCQGTIDGFLSRQDQGGEGAKGKQHLIIGPWTHMWPRDKSIGDFEVPSLAYQPPVDISMRSWLAHHLKGESNSCAELPSVTYYVMGPFDNSPSTGNVWRTSNVWPVPAVNTTFYLSHGTQLTDNSLALEAEGSSGFTYDPNLPVPPVGGRNLFLEAGPKDQRHLEAREDVLVFTSQQLAEDLEVTGRVSARVFLSTDQMDTDLVVKLCDVYPDGRSVLIADGIRRVGSLRSEEEIAGDEPIAVDVDLETTSMVFAKGHQLRVSITSSNYPRYEKNLNIPLSQVGKADAKIAHNTIFYGEKYSSRIVLPVVKHGA
jgi:putative CocE/NonD family hydrolase